MDNKKTTRFGRLASHIAHEYEAKGIPVEEAQEWGKATAAKVGREKYGEKKMEEKSEQGKEENND